MSRKPSQTDYILTIEFVENQDEAMEGYMRAVKAILNNDKTDENTN